MSRLPESLVCEAFVDVGPSVFNPRAHTARGSCCAVAVVGASAEQVPAAPVSGATRLLGGVGDSPTLRADAGCWKKQIIYNYN